MCSVIQVKLTKISYIEFKVRLIQDSGLFRIWLRQVYIYNICTLSDNIIFICMSFRNGNKSKLLVSIKVSSPFDHWDMYSSVHSSCSLPESGSKVICFYLTKHG